MTSPTPTCTTIHPTAGAPPSRSSPFWTRYKTLINFWLDVTLLFLFLTQAWLLTVLAIVFPRGAAHATIWGGVADDWLDLLFSTFCVFTVGILLHLMLHWTWICGTVSTRLLGRKAVKDDGSQTLIGVGLLILLLHIFVALILTARAYLLNPI